MCAIKSYRYFETSENTRRDIELFKTKLLNCKSKINNTHLHIYYVLVNKN